MKYLKYLFYSAVITVICLTFYNLHLIRQIQNDIEITNHETGNDLVVGAIQIDGTEKTWIDNEYTKDVSIIEKPVDIKTADRKKPTKESFITHINEILNTNNQITRHFASRGHSTRPFTLYNPQVTSYDINSATSMVNTIQGSARVKYNGYSAPWRGANAIYFDNEYQITSGFKGEKWSVLNIRELNILGMTPVSFFKVQ